MSYFEINRMIKKYKKNSLKISLNTIQDMAYKYYIDNKISNKQYDNIVLKIDALLEAA